MEATQIITDYLRQVLFTPESAELVLQSIPEEEREFAEAVKDFCEAVIEGHRFSVALADGELDKEFDGRNPFIGALKELQSGLRHFSWQIKQVAKGEYTHRAEFLGEFSAGFNEMTQQLNQRHELLVQNHKLEIKLEKKEKEALLRQLEQQKAHYRSLNEMNRKIASFKHDTRNHYLCMDSLLAHGEVEQARKYLASISVGLNHTVKIINTENYIFDALLTEKILMAEAAGIQVEQWIRLRPNVKVENFDWTILLGNAMDNAIEACSFLNSAQEKKIQIQIRVQKNILNVAIKNTELPPVRNDQGDFVTSKGDLENHGFGLKNIKDAVEKYDGVMQTQYKEGCFILSFMLCDI